MTEQFPSKEIVHRLRQEAWDLCGESAGVVLMHQASDEIVSLRADVDRLRLRLAYAEALIRWAVTDNVDDSTEYGNEARCFLQGGSPAIPKRHADVASVRHSGQASPPVAEMADITPRSPQRGYGADSPSESCADVAPTCYCTYGFAGDHEEGCPVTSRKVTSGVSGDAS